MTYYRAIQELFQVVLESVYVVYHGWQEMQQSMNMLTNPKQNMPDISETLTNWFGGGGSSTSSGSAKKPGIKGKATKKKQ